MIILKICVPHFNKMPDFSQEIFYRTSRSGGKGGQNVNKVETAVEAWWQVTASRHFTEEEKALIADKLQNRINKEGCLLVRSSATRSQLENKEIARQLLLDLVQQSLVVPKKRKASRPSRTAVEKRLEAKKREAFKKQQRRKDW